MALAPPLDLMEKAMTPDKDHCTQCQKAHRAFERRFGKSMLPLRVKHRSAKIVHVFDPETGSSADFDCSGWRIRRITEDDANA